MKDCEWEAQELRSTETELANIWWIYVSTSSSLTKPEERDFNVLLPSWRWKEIQLCTCSRVRCVFIIELIVFCCSSWHCRLAILGSQIILQLFKVYRFLSRSGCTIQFIWLNWAPSENFRRDYMYSLCPSRETKRCAVRGIHTKMRCDSKLGKSFVLSALVLASADRPGVSVDVSCWPWSDNMYNVNVRI